MRSVRFVIPAEMTAEFGRVMEPQQMRVAVQPFAEARADRRLAVGYQESRHQPLHLVPRQQHVMDSASKLPAQQECHEGRNPDDAGAASHLLGNEADQLPERVDFRPHGVERHVLAFLSGSNGHLRHVNDVDGLKPVIA